MLALSRIYRKEVYVQIKDANKEAAEQKIDVAALNKLFTKQDK